jgi:putative endonuclease
MQGSGDGGTMWSRGNCWLFCLEWLHGVLKKAGNQRKHLPEHLRVGLEGEDAAYFYLRRKGYIVVARRWGIADLRGDLDLIAWKEELLCIVEVKTRTARDAYSAESMVDEEKRTHLRRLARAYLRRLRGEEAPPVRFDILSVYLLPGQKPQFEHFENAFGWSARESGRWNDRW